MSLKKEFNVLNDSFPPCFNKIPVIAMYYIYKYIKLYYYQYYTLEAYQEL